MAKLGTVTARWRKSLGSDRVREFALRTDGVLLEKTTWLKANGTVDHTGGGWKIASRKPKRFNVLCEVFAQRGYDLI
ncbi:hypothetical protein LCGC14_2651970 [marine sediment metagenome]|uniref:Uncharacterized protein n=1 Tax=marine sediment metagenome TaxID=412755 RepID=A0A0F9C4X0_9ZZZZ